MSSIDRYYKILGLQPGASPAEVKQAYRALAKTWHPDQFMDDPTVRRQAEEQLKAINDAYHQLKDYQPQTTSNWTVDASSSYQTTRVNVSTTRTNAEFWYNRGAENASLGQYKAAIDDFSMAIRLNPNYVEAYRYRGFAHSMLGFELGAESDLQRAKTLELEHQMKERSSSSPDRTQSPSSPPSNAATPDKQSSSMIDGQLLQVWRDHTDTVSSIAVSRDGKFLVSGSHDRTIKFWSLKTGSIFHTLTTHPAPITAIALSLNGQLLATGDADHTIRLWDLKLGTLLRSLNGHNGKIHTLAFSPDNQLLISGGQDGRLNFWTLKTSRITPISVRQDAPVLALAISPDGQLAFCGSDDHSLTVYQTRTGEVLRSLLGQASKILSVAMSPIGVVATGAADGSIALWAETAIVTGKLERLWNAHSKAVEALTLSPNSRLLASDGDDGTVQLWSLTGDRLATLAGHRGNITALAFSPSGQTLFSSSSDHTICLWQVASL